MPMCTTLPLQAKPVGQHRDEDPRIKAVEEHLEDAVDGNQSGNVVGVPLASSFQTSTMAMHRAIPIRIRPAHIGRLAAQEHDGKKNISAGPMSQFWSKRQPEYPLVAEDLAELFVSDLGQRRKHHDDEADGDGYIRRARLWKRFTNASGAWDEMADRDANGHGKKDPESQKSVEK